MICKKCGKYHPLLEPCYHDLPHKIVIRYTSCQLTYASDKEIANEIRRRGLIALPHPNPQSPDYSLPVLTPKHLSNAKRRAWRRYCLELLSQVDTIKIAT